MSISLQAPPFPSIPVTKLNGSDDDFTASKMVAHDVAQIAANEAQIKAEIAATTVARFGRVLHDANKIEADADPIWAATLAVARRKAIKAGRDAAAAKLLAILHRAAGRNPDAYVDGRAVAYRSKNI